MDNKLPGSDFAVEAVYTKQRIARFQNNVLIEALPPVATDDQLIQALTMRADFAPEQARWPVEERLLQVAGLVNLMVPFEHHIGLARSIETMLREGYVGRSPRSAEHIAIFRQNYASQKAGLAASCNPLTARPQLSSALIGVSGGGKSVALQRILSLIPPVIYHPELRFWQVPYLHIQTPDDGASVTGLIHNGFRKLDELIPDAHYLETYALHGRPSVPALISRFMKVLNMHCVGILILDEIQNLANAPKNKQELMTILVSISNAAQVPILFVGTNKARSILQLAFRQARRSVGYGATYWDRLASSGNIRNPGDWEAFLGALWPNQWVRSPVPLSDMYSQVMYFYTQGVPDIAVKTFAACQWRAMLDGSETITPDLIKSVATRELAMVAPMITALRERDLKALELYDDVAPLNLADMLRAAKIRYEGQRVSGASVHPGDATFVPAVADVLTGLGVAAEDAEHIASSVASAGTVRNVLDGTKEALAMLDTPKRTKRRGADTAVPERELEPADYRNAIRRAVAEGTTTFAQLEKMGAVCDVEKVLALA